MELFLSTSLVIALTLIVIIFLSFLYVKWRFTYWQRKKIISLKPKLPFGNLENPWTTLNSQGKQYENFYRELKRSGAPFGGVYAFMTPIFIPVDHEYIKCILAKDFQNFHARGFYCNEEEQPISAHLFSVDGIKWKNLRTKFTPTFTPGKTKSMFESVLNCTEPLKVKLREFALHKKPIVVKNITSYYTIDVIGTCAFGLECNSFTDPETKIHNLVRYAMDEGTKLLKLAFCFSFPNLAKKLKLVQFPHDAAAFFTKIIVETVAHREQNNISRRDFLQLLIDMKNKEVFEANEEIDKLTMNEIVSQSFLFFMAGFDTSAITMHFCLFELACNKDIQERLRKEINSVLAKYNNELTYEALADMKYLQQVLDETLRKYPPLPVINRKCTQDYALPFTNHIIEEGTEVVVPIRGLHHDPDYYPDPEKFDPERFSEENKKNRPGYAYLPFGEGPRHCIGLRFGTMTAKTGLAAMIKNFRFSVNPEIKLPLVFNSQFLLTPTENILLDVETVID